MDNIKWTILRTSLRKNGLELISTDQFIKDIGFTTPSASQLITNWEEMSDSELIDLFTNIPSDDLIVVSEACYTIPSDPFIVKRECSMGIFILNYFRKFKESLFNGDVIILGPESNYVGIFHHEGIIYEGKIN